MFMNYVRFRHGILWKKCTNQTESIQSTDTGTIFDKNYNKVIFYCEFMIECFNNGIYT